jgi:hypothetical protein
MDAIHHDNIADDDIDGDDVLLLVLRLTADELQWNIDAFNKKAWQH